MISLQTKFESGMHVSNTFDTNPQANTKSKQEELDLAPTFLENCLSSDSVFQCPSHHML